MKLAGLCRIISVVVPAVTLSGASAPLFAQGAKGEASNYPARPIRLIVPAAPGGTTDTLARLFGGRLTEIFGHQVVVDKRASVLQRMIRSRPSMSGG
jgi:tripartite-type tricarboxylate transporter receptor subunit TctC